jgi:hypothetical protein
METSGGIGGQKSEVGGRQSDDGRRTTDSAVSEVLQWVTGNEPKPTTMTSNFMLLGFAAGPGAEALATLADCSTARHCRTLAGN